MRRPGWRWAVRIGPGALLAVSMASTASAQIGQPIVEIQLDQDGRVVNDVAVIRLIETRVGDLLSVRSARETITHDREVNQLDILVDEECLKVIALHQPAAGDLRLTGEPPSPISPRWLFAT